MVLAIRCHRQNMKTSIINGSEVSRLSVAIHIGAASLLFESAILGGFICCWGGNFDRASKHKRELDTICFALFGKSYESSHLDIIGLDKTKST
ncbi:hypothetical protein L8O39_09955, partial [Enterobacter kobei]|nr:hypothetical protein [Enterobacter kobei]